MSHSRKPSVKMIKAIAVLLTLAIAQAWEPTTWQDINPSSRIIKGENANPGEFPFMVSLRRRTDNKHGCGGSILTKKWILTAAHCCERIKDNNATIYAGSIHLSHGGSYHVIETIIMHEEYDSSNLWRNDVCLIRIYNPFTFDKNVQQVVLPPPNWPIHTGERLVLSGWGSTTPGIVPDDTPNQLQKSDTFFGVENDLCGNETHTEMFSGYLCARGGVKGQGVSFGDSGSPLTKNGVQVGITSWTHMPCGSGLPDFFARVPEYVNWIKGQLGWEASQLKFFKESEN